MSNKNMTCPEVLREIQLKLMESGETAFSDTCKKLDKYDHKRTGVLNKSELITALNKSGIFLGMHQIATLIRNFGDNPKEDAINIAKFTSALVGKMNDRRSRMCNKVFTEVDRNNNGYLEKKEMLKRYNPKAHPEVESSEMDEEIALANFRIIFNMADSNMDQKVSRQEFIDTCTTVSVCIPFNDDHFCSIMSATWGVSEHDQEEKGNGIDQQLQTVLNVLKEKVRQKTKGTDTTNCTLTKYFKFQNLKTDDIIDYPVWKAVLERFGVVLVDDLNLRLFKTFEKSPGQGVDYGEFADYLFGKGK